MSIPLTAAKRATIGGAPEGLDALLLAEAEQSVLHICRDDTRMTRMAGQIGFFAPGRPVLLFPAWDTVPYDRTSPNGDIVAQRLHTLLRLASGIQDGCIVVTTINAVLQRVPPRTAFQGASIAAAVGERLAQADLFQALDRNGYRRSGTVREPGEFAVRGGIVDLFPPGAPEPLRLDFFGDELEHIRRFDPMSQRTTGEAERFDIGPVSEVILDDAAVQRFRAGYRESFGVVAGNDPLYAAISTGQRAIGMEHWLPLFHERLETLFDYLPDAAVTFDQDSDAAIDARLDLIADFYDARRSMVPATLRDAENEAAPVYKPVPPDSMFLDRLGLDAILAERAVATFDPFPPPRIAENSIDAGGRRGHEFTEARQRSDVNLFDVLRTRIVAESGRLVLVAGRTAGSRDRLGSLLAEHGLPKLPHAADWAEAQSLRGAPAVLIALDIDRGFETADFVVHAEQDILGDELRRPARRRRRAEQFISEISALSAGDLVVHVDHGIGRYDGLETLQVGGAPHDCLRLIYAGDDKLFVPVENIEVLSRFGSEESQAQLDRLGAPAWQARKARAKARIRDIAQQLLGIAAARLVKQGEPLSAPADSYEEFCARFAWSETEDQQRAIDETVDDLGSGRPVDRLICGDVGYGKTEVAMRAAFVAAMAGKQVAMVVPTTLLAQQHYRNFVKRFAGVPVRIEQLSRLNAGKAAALVRDGLADGSVDIVVGTHSLLAASVKFRDLGLLIVDEEQHFGVSQKERLKRLKADVHVLTLTATPIPRTLQMALAGVRDMSIIATPPVDRLAVRTFVLPYDGVVIREAIQRERFRGGQCFYVCPRVADLDRVRQRLAELVPEATVATAHGQMPAQELEEVMADFCNGKYDILLSTNIVEAGLDIPAANTMIIHRADRFGLAQLYQLRGRIGRSKTRAYAYLTLPPGQVLTETAKKRLEVMQALDTLGAGFTLASHDLDIRGAGNLLGEEQSGHIREVGVELYQQMLEEAIAALRDEPGGSGAGQGGEDQWTPEIAVGTSVLIPVQYVADLYVRLGLYRRLSLVYG
ncbi:MAG: transcription-repair coupling factor, partial [Alphaproteobacteria bacterium]